MFIGRIVLMLVLTASIGVAQIEDVKAPPPPKPLKLGPAILDGTELEGYGIALAYLQTTSKKWPMRFQIKNYIVAFEGNWTYHFIPKPSPKDVKGTELVGANGPASRIKVSRKTRKVISAVVE